MLVRTLDDPKLLIAQWMAVVGMKGFDGVRFWDQQHDIGSRDGHPLGRLLRYLAPYRWLLDFGTTEQLDKKITVLREAEQIIVGEMERDNDKGIPPFYRLLFRSQPKSLLVGTPDSIPSTTGQILAADVLKMNEEQPGALQLSQSQVERLKKKVQVPPPLFVTKNGVSALRKKTECFRNISARSEEYLRTSFGLRFDAKKRKLVGKEKHRGRELLTLCIFALSQEFGSDAKARMKIKKCLSPIFAEELDPSRRGNIATAIANARRQR